MNDSQGTALITGAARRIGAAIARALAEDGWAVAIHYGSSKADAEALARAINEGGGTAVALGADLNDSTATGALVARAEDALGPVTALINNASTFEKDDIRTVTEQSWNAHMTPNLWAPALLTQQMAARLPAGREGNIINIADERVWNLTPYFLSYTISKAGLWALTQTTALALAPRIRVNAIGPGPTLPSPRQTQAQFDAQARAMPLERGTSPEEICAAARFILAAPAMCGQMIALDGGQHLGWAHPPTPPPPE